MRKESIYAFSIKISSSILSDTTYAVELFTVYTWK